MKKLIPFMTLFAAVLICFPAVALEDKIVAGEPVGKLIKADGDLRLQRYGVRFITEDGSQRKVGLYKISIGDPDKLKKAKKMNKVFGFDGLIFITTKEKKDHWQKIRVHRPSRFDEGRKERAVIAKNLLPMPFSSMPDELLGKIQFFNIYPDNDDVAVVYIVEETGLSDCESIFDYLSRKQLRSKNQTQL